MQMLYNSDSYVVVHFDLTVSAQTGARTDAPPDARPGDHPGAPAAALAAGVHRAMAHAGFEIVDKRAGRETWLDGALAERFIAGAQALAAQAPSQEDCDDYIAGFASLAQQPLSLH